MAENLGYLQPKLQRGYNAYLNSQDAPEVGMDVGLLLLEAGDVWIWEEKDCELACVLLQGQVRLAWAGQQVEAKRQTMFGEEATCLHVCCAAKVTVTALAHAELYCQATQNERPFDSRLYTAQDVMVRHAGSNNELLGAMRRDIKTFFDYESAPWSNMVLGEVLNFPGKWSSYPPHHHPQPEVYFHRFDYPNGFGASFANGEVYTSRHNGLTVILEGFHSQTAAPGYAMCYLWGIRHLPGDPWRKTRLDDPGHEWLWQEDANKHIYNPEAKP